MPITRAQKSRNIKKDMYKIYSLNVEEPYIKEKLYLHLNSNNNNKIQLINFIKKIH